MKGAFYYQCIIHGCFKLCLISQIRKRIGEITWLQDAGSIPD